MALFKKQNSKQNIVDDGLDLVSNEQIEKKFKRKKRLIILSSIFGFIGLVVCSFIIVQALQPKSRGLSVNLNEIVDKNIPSELTIKNASSLYVEGGKAVVSSDLNFNTSNMTFSWKKSTNNGTTWTDVFGEGTISGDEFVDPNGEKNFSKDDLIVKNGNEITWTNGTSLTINNILLSWNNTQIKLLVYINNKLWKESNSISINVTTAN